MPKYLQTIVALVLVLWTNALILFGLNISPAKEAALETIVNTAALLGFLAYGAVHTYVLNKHKTEVAVAQAYSDRFEVAREGVSS